MTERPILFSGPMVRAILESRKTQTRRPVKPQLVGHHWEALPDYRHQVEVMPDSKGAHVRSTHWQGAHADPFSQTVRCPYGSAGDHLWVRETWAGGERVSTEAGSFRDAVVYRADVPERDVRDEAYARKLARIVAEGVWGGPWRPAIHMPRGFSRITLEVTGVRCHRLHEITASDVAAEGVDLGEVDNWRQWLHPDDAPAHTFGVRWDAIYGKGPFHWASNPWVWAVTFRRA